MVKERRYVFDVSDITSLLYVCSECGQEVACKLENVFQPSENCSSCNAFLKTEDSSAPDPSYMVLMQLRRIQKVTKPRVQLRFVVSDPDIFVNQ